MDSERTFSLVGLFPAPTQVVVSRVTGHLKYRYVSNWLTEGP